MCISSGKPLWLLGWVLLMSPAVLSDHGQDGRYDPSRDGRGWDIRLSVPGEPERDYPTLARVPPTAFNCNGKDAGYYADIDTRCQVFRVCAVTASGGFFSFLCPNGTLFNQEVLVCDWWMNVKCPEFDNKGGTGIGPSSRLTMKPGPAMMADITKMITYPMKNPYTESLPPMKRVMQVYNPPEDMFSGMQPTLNPNTGGELIADYKLPPMTTGSGTPTGRAFDQDAFNGNPDGQGPMNVQFEGVVPNNQGGFPLNQGNIGSPFAPQRTDNLSLQKSFNANLAQQAIKITKQQFTYPSQFDKQYTLTVPQVPQTNGGQPLIIRVPINIPAIDTNQNAVSGKLLSLDAYNQLQSSAIQQSFDNNNYHQSFDNNNYQQSFDNNNYHQSFNHGALMQYRKPLPLFLLLLKPTAHSLPVLIPQPPLNAYKQNVVAQTSNHVITNKANFSETNARERPLFSSNYKLPAPRPFSKPETPTNIENSTSQQHTQATKNISKITKNGTTVIKTNKGSQFTANVASQTNYYITNNLAKKEKPEPKEKSNSKELPDFSFEPEAENITVAPPIMKRKPARLTLDPDFEVIDEPLTNHSSSSSTPSSSTNLTKDKSSSTINKTTFVKTLRYTQEPEIITNATKANSTNDKNLVTLFSAHIIPSGDTSMEKILKLCIPKDFFSLLINLTNSTKTKLQLHTQNAIAAYKDAANSIKTDSSNIGTRVPIIRQIMQNFLIRNNFSNLQVPIFSGEERYEKQLFTQNILKNTAAFTSAFNSTSATTVQKQNNLAYTAQAFQQNTGNLTSQQNAANFTSSQSSEFAPQSPISAPYTQGTGEEGNTKITQAGYYEATKGNLQQNGNIQSSLQKTQQSGFFQASKSNLQQNINSQTSQNTEQSNIEQKNQYNQIKGVSQTNQFSSKYTDGSISSFKNEGSNGQAFGQQNVNQKSGQNQFTGTVNNQAQTLNQNTANTQASQFEAYKQNNENLMTQGVTKYSGSNTSGDQNPKLYYNQFDTSSISGPQTRTEIENQGEFFSVQQNRRARPKPKSPAHNVQGNNPNNEDNTNNSEQENTGEFNSQEINSKTDSQQVQIADKQNVQKQSNQNSQTKSNQVSGIRSENFNNGQLVSVQQQNTNHPTQFVKTNNNFGSSFKENKNTNSVLTSEYNKQVTDANEVQKPGKLVTTQEHNSDSASGQNIGTNNQQTDTASFTKQGFFSNQQTGTNSFGQMQQRNDYFGQIRKAQNHNSQIQTSSTPFTSFQQTTFTNQQNFAPAPVQQYSAQKQISFFQNQNSNEAAFNEFSSHNNVQNRINQAQNIVSQMGANRNNKQIQQGQNQQTNFNQNHGMNQGSLNSQFQQQNRLYSAQQQTGSQNLFQGHNQFQIKAPDSVSHSTFPASHINNAALYTTIEVVPAYGFSLDSDQERQEYFTALSNGLKNVGTIYKAPYSQQTAAFTSSSDSGGSSVLDSSAFNERQFQNAQLNNFQGSLYSGNTIRSPSSSGFQSQSAFTSSQFESPGPTRILSAQVLSTNHPQISSFAHQSLPIESFGYPQEKPSISFTF